MRDPTCFRALPAAERPARRGWYVDGRRFDHYVGWAFHFYTLLWARMDGDSSDPPRAAVYRQRVRRYLEDYRHLFGANGAALYQGRSLIYRWATLAPLWVGTLLEASTLSPGETRGLASRVLRYFVDAGALEGRVLSMGWHGEFLPMVQPFSGPASRYWASKGFLGLLVPADHSVRTAEEQPLPVEQADFCRAMAQSGFFVVGDGGRRGCSRLHGLGGTATSSAASPDPHYDRIAYATHTAPDVNGSDGGSMQAALLSPRARPHLRAVARPPAQAMSPRTRSGRRSRA